MESELRAKIHASMKEHLESKGWPDISDDEIAQELPELWAKLGSEGLLDSFLKRGFKFEHFVYIALQKKKEIEIMEWARAEAEAFADMFRRK